MNRIPFLAAGALAPLFFALPLRSQEAVPLADLDAYVTAAMADWRVPGLSLAIYQGGRVALAKGYGARALGADGAVDADTFFAIASNTKAFTATALGLLVSEGPLQWETPVQEILPGFALHDPLVTRRITVRDLLCHRAGLPTFGGDLVWFGSSYPRAEVLERIRHVEPSYDFRTGYGYSNLMYLVAGELIPHVAGVSWDAFLAERFFKPLGMRRTNTAVSALRGDDNVAAGHTLHSGAAVQVPYVDMDNAAPAGAINSCARDMLNWLRCQAEGGVLGEERVIPEAVIAETRRPHSMLVLGDAARKFNPSTHLAAYGLGFGLRDYQGRLLVRHTGGLDGMYSIVALVPEERLGVCVLSNLDDHDLTHALAFHVIDELLSVPFQDWNAKYLERRSARSPERIAALRRGIATRIPGTRPTHPPAAYAGRYANPLYGLARIAFDRGALRLQLLAHPCVGELEHWHADVFMASWDSPVWKESAVRFELGPEGEVAAFRIRVRPDWIDPVEYRFVRL